MMKNLYKNLKKFIFLASLESARKNTADFNYQTTDEERLGRGKRQHVPCSKYSEEEEKEYEASCSQPRQYKMHSKYNKNVNYYININIFI